MDTEGLLKSLNEHRVRYVVIGASAFPVHGYARATLDLDLFIDATPENAEATHRALTAFGYDLSDVTVEDLLRSKILIRQYILEVDVHPFVKGATFSDVWNRRVAGTVGAASTAFASLEDLIAMKKAAGRPKDIEDLRYLTRLQKSRP